VARCRLCLSSNDDLKNYTDYLRSSPEIVISLKDEREEWIGGEEYIDIDPINLQQFVITYECSHRDIILGDNWSEFLLSVIPILSVSILPTMKHLF
jgi:hypothetical protein